MRDARIVVGVGVILGNWSLYVMIHVIIVYSYVFLIFILLPQKCFFVRNSLSASETVRR